MTERQKLIKELDRVFSIFIRRRDATDEVGKCITCGKMMTWKTMDCGHFIGRQHSATRWEEKNCAMQCKQCNGFEEGRKYIFAKRINEIYGEGTAEMLLIKSKNSVKFDNGILRLLIEKYKKYNDKN